MEVLTTLFGSYGHKMSIDLLQQKTPDRPSLAMLHMKRLIWAEEPDSRCPLNGGRIKEIVGGSKAISARRLYSSDDEVLLACSMFLCCNNTPQIAGSDKAIANRLFVIEFDSVFVSDQKEADESKRVFYTERFVQDQDTFRDEYLFQLIHIFIDIYQKNAAKNDGIFVMTPCPKAKVLAESFMDETVLCFVIILALFSVCIVMNCDCDRMIC